MIDGLSAVRTGVDYEAETIVEVLLLCNFVSCGEQLAQKFGVGGGGVGEGSEVSLGDNQDMHRRLWIDIREREHMIALIESCDRDRTAGDLAEEAVGVCSHVRMLNLRGYFLKYFGSIPGTHGL
jgi:hypothetical protein